jgi:4-hydroxysphinganine ceramide fatty acyl 2-hydroxylase
VGWVRVIIQAYVFIYLNRSRVPAICKSCNFGGKKKRDEGVLECAPGTVVLRKMSIVSISQLVNPQKCLVTRGSRVYDVTSFLEDHPGGAEIIAVYRGKDVSLVMADVASHEHSPAAYDMLEDYYVGTTTTAVLSAMSDSDDTAVEDVYSTGMTCEEDLNVPTNISADFARHKFLDLSHPLLPQVLSGGFTKQFYLQQIHRPRHYPFGSAKLMPYAWMEPFSKTPWWVVPLVWMPWVGYGTWLASRGLSAL